MEQTLRLNSELAERKVTANISGMTALNACISLQQFVHIIFGWKNRYKLVRIMNYWQRDLNQNDEARSESFWYYTLVCVGATYVLFNTASSFSISFNVPQHPDRAVEVAYLSLVLSYWPITENLQDILVILTFHELATNYKQVLQCDIFRRNFFLDHLIHRVVLMCVVFKDFDNF